MFIFANYLNQKVRKLIPLQTETSLDLFGRRVFIALFLVHSIPVLFQL